MASRHPLPDLAKTVAGVVHGTDSIATKIRNRAELITYNFVHDVMSLLEIGYPGRRPRLPVDSKGRPRPTDMDLASFLVGLTTKPTIIELPAYTALTPRIETVGQRHLSPQRYGKLLSLSSHREQLSFGVTIEDMSISHRSAREEDSLGAPRTFNIISYDGVWHEGWRGISWQFRKDEMDFRERYDLLTDANHQGYQYFVHPNRRHSMFSRAHLLLKLLWYRLDDEIDYWTKNVLGRAEPITPEISHREHSKSVLVPVFVVELKGLPLFGEYPTLHDDTNEHIMNRVRFLRQMRTRVQFLVRANEYAFYLYGRRNDYVAGWIRDGHWQHRRQTSVYRDDATLTLSSTVSIRYTIDTVSKLVAAH